MARKTTHNYYDFKKRWAFETNRIRGQQTTLARKVIVSTFGRILVLSPVKTGRYRAAHQITIGGPATSSPIGGATEGAGNQLSAAETYLASKLKPGQSLEIFISNPLIYAWAIEAGHSKQAPQGVYLRAREYATQLWGKVTGGVSL